MSWVFAGVCLAIALFLAIDRRRLRAEAARTNDGRDVLVRTVVDAAPMAIVLFSDGGRILVANAAARDLFFEGKSSDGANFLSLLPTAPDPLAKAIIGDRDELFTVEQDGERETYHLAKRVLDIGGAPHTLLMVKHLTGELTRQEIEVWKKLFRVISHELNNSLAPITSLAHSGRKLASSGNLAALDRVFDTIGERAEHLKTFLDGYAKFARIPAPRPARVEWREFLAGISALHPRAKISEPPAEPGFFDVAQLQQVLINLLKNAEESGGAPEDVTVDVTTQPDGATRVVVADRGRGMSKEVLEHALLPFYSTKEKGSGLGLALCREIIEAHGGRIRLKSREGGGTEVSFRLPGAAARGMAPRALLTLTRA